MLHRQRQEKFEETVYYHKYATRSTNSKGRLSAEDEDDTRVCFERDGNRILHSLPFRRLKHKTQVFFFPENDHICTRMEHALLVSSIASTVAKCLGLNTDLVDAIAKGHDLGHAPFGHCGETILKEIVEKEGREIPFEHEIHGLRVVDKLAMIPGREGIGLNLTFEVRDGIACHYGEEIEEKLEPDLEKSLEDLYDTKRGESRPATLEGCLVRFVDKVAYLGRDMEDAINAELIKREEIPSLVKEKLGDTNGKIIGILVDDTIKNNKKHPEVIMLNTEIWEAMQQLLKFNQNNIYKAEKVVRYERNAKRVITLLFEDLFNYLGSKSKPEWTRETKDELKVPRVYRYLHDYIRVRNLVDESPKQVVLDYISGMTDNFAVACFDELFIPKPIT